MKLSAITFASCAASLSVSFAANAAVVNVYVDSASGVGSGTSYGAAYQGTIVWSYTSGGTATIDVNLTNTSSVVSYLFAFVVGMQDSSFVVTQTSAPSPFSQLIGNDLTATPFGDFDWGSSATGSFNGGGGGNVGLAQGASGSWTFSVSGAAASLAAVNNASVFNGANQWDFVAHLKGITSGSGTVSEKLTSNLIVPGPGAFVLLALAGVVSRRRRA